MAKMEEEAIVLYPSPAIGHLISLVELAKFILSRRPSLSVHILLPPAAYASAGSTAPYIASVSDSIPSIKFHHLPNQTLSITAEDVKHFETLTFRLLRFSNPHVHKTLEDISKTYTIKAFIIDFFCTCSLTVASQLGIPTFYYFTSPAGCLAFFLHLSTLHESTTKSFKELGRTPLYVPGVPPLPASDTPKPVMYREDEAYGYFLEFSEVAHRSAGILINTFEALEARTVRALREGLCMPGNPNPPLYCIGPLISDRKDEVARGECLKWLDSQPNKSVIFFCFGSLGLFSKAQLEEIAVGIEKSGKRFLWVVRNPPNNDNDVALDGGAEPDLDALLPEGFLERTKDKGFVVKSWAPQVAVLNHGAVGGFVSHCGWNSVLEAVRAGVPMVAWPLYAEQRLNRVLLVEEIKIGIPMVEREEDGFVGRDEVERRVRELMESERGAALRERSAAMREAAWAALEDGGSSIVDLDNFFASWKQTSGV